MQVIATCFRKIIVSKQYKFFMKKVFFRAELVSKDEYFSVIFLFLYTSLTSLLESLFSRNRIVFVIEKQFRVLRP